jgi:hypothetical protein
MSDFPKPPPVLCTCSDFWKRNLGPHSPTCVQNQAAFALIGRVTGVCSVKRTYAEAIGAADRYNADPFLEPELPDPDAPYDVKVTTLGRLREETGANWGWSE